MGGGGAAVRDAAGLTEGARAAVLIPLGGGTVGDASAVTHFFNRFAAGFRLVSTGR
ncbi:MAG: hypothetical protein IRZ13_17975 [Acetobacteraceae bacterium]|nr:hypothetical protein [Acetobacteraceae bacterium]